MAIASRIVPRSYVNIVTLDIPLPAYADLTRAVHPSHINNNETPAPSNPFIEPVTPSFPFACAINPLTSYFLASTKQYTQSSNTQASLFEEFYNMTPVPNTRSLPSTPTQPTIISPFLQTSRSSSTVTSDKKQKRLGQLNKIHSLPPKPNKSMEPQAKPKPITPTTNWAPTLPFNVQPLPCLTSHIALRTQ